MNLQKQKSTKDQGRYWFFHKNLEILVGWEWNYHNHPIYIIKSYYLSIEDRVNDSLLFSNLQLEYQDMTRDAVIAKCAEFGVTIPDYVLEEMAKENDLVEKYPNTEN